MAKAPIDTTTTYLHLDEDPRVHEISVTPEFWSSIHGRTELHRGRLLMRFTFDESWGYEEMHPSGDEILYVTQGQLEVILRSASPEQSDRRVELSAGEAFVVPAGIWHTARVSEPTEVLFLTHGRGTEHRPLKGD